MIFCDFVISVCDFFVISREVYEQKSVISPSNSMVPDITGSLMEILLCVMEWYIDKKVYNLNCKHCDAN